MQEDSTVEDLNFYTSSRQCPICMNPINNFSTTFPIQNSFCRESRKFKMTTCGHPICSSCFQCMMTTLSEEETPTSLKCPICRFEAHHFLKLDMEHSYISDLMNDNYALQCELRQMSLLCSEKRKESSYYKLKSLIYLAMLRKKSFDAEENDQDTYISDEFQDCISDTDSGEQENMEHHDERPINSRYHRRNVRRQQEVGSGLSDSTLLERTIAESDSDTDATSLPPVDTDWKQSINDICAVVINRLERLHTRVAVLESRDTSERLDNLKRNYDLKKYETIILENEISNLKKRHLENFNLNLRAQQ